MIQQTGEYLSFNDPQTNILKPMLATSWKPNTDASVWTYNLRPGVKFNDGTPMTADDVVYSFQQNTDPKVYVNAASVFTEVLDKDGVKKIDDQTVEFNLEAPVGNFPYLISSDNYNMIIVPNGTDYTKWAEDLPRHRPVQDDLLPDRPRERPSPPTPTGGAARCCRPSCSTSSTTSSSRRSWRCPGGDVDIVNLIVPQGAEAVLNNPDYKLWVTKSSQHRELVDALRQKPWNDKNVRQAMALSLNRPEIAQALFKGYAQLGNDNAVRADLPLDRHRPCRSGCRTSTRPSS